MLDRGTHRLRDRSLSTNPKGWQREKETGNEREAERERVVERERMS